MQIQFIQISSNNIVIFSDWIGLDWIEKVIWQSDRINLLNLKQSKTTQFFFRLFTVQLSITRFHLTSCLNSQRKWLSSSALNVVILYGLQNPHFVIYAVLCTNFCNCFKNLRRENVLHYYSRIISDCGWIRFGFQTLTNCWIVTIRSDLMNSMTYCIYSNIIIIMKQNEINEWN